MACLVWLSIFADLISVSGRLLYDSEEAGKEACATTLWPSACMASFPRAQ